MAPKKSKASKMSLNEFLGDSTLGSWADEMDALPTAPSIKTDDDRPSRHGDRFSRRDDFASSRPDRPFPSVREEVPLPSQPPFTAFIGNLAFDITETELASFFAPSEAKSIKIIKDREDKPKGFGYIEFSDLDALKDALSRTGTSLSGRTIRVSVAEPPKEKSGFGGGIPEEDSKFSGNWRREGPLPSFGDSRESSRRRFDGPPGERPPPPSNVSDEVSDWRSSRPMPKAAETEVPQARRRGSGFSTTEGQIGAAEREEHWTMGSKFKPSAPEESTHGSKFGSVKGKYESVHARERDTPDEGDWRARRVPGGTSPTSSTPPTPQISRKRLELLPRSSTGSTSPSPLSSPKLASNAPRPNPFGAAKPVDISAKEREITARLDHTKPPQHSMSRTNSRQATERGSTHPSKVSSTSPSTASPSGASVAVANSVVRPSFSFANAASTKTTVVGRTDDQKAMEDTTSVVQDASGDTAQMSI